MRTIVLRLIGDDREGQWIVVDSAPVWLRPDGPSVSLVPTGSVEWHGDKCAEVYVPQDKLDLWRAEHEVDP